MPRRRSSEEEEEEEEERPQRNAANARERARMRVLSRAFCRLKTTLPWVPADTKLSKLDTLRLATSYIAHLRRVLNGPANQAQPPSPLSMSWPFTFQPQHHEAQQAQETQNYINYYENPIQIG
ncbi:transcription factor 21-like [Cimex lectularius]|uniref:BHLH domain-containing protein n=1 Tax=Cimex lectularius TaxID=79782 RepID=A0A8I6S777_CIMLE|nr:transcription factor 21-like [Cimex lectularius]